MTQLGPVIPPKIILLNISDCRNDQTPGVFPDKNEYPDSSIDNARIFAIHLFPENSIRIFRQQFPPLGDLIRLEVEVLRRFGKCFISLHRSLGHFRFTKSVNVSYELSRLLEPLLTDIIGQ